MIGLRATTPAISDWDADLPADLQHLQLDREVSGVSTATERLRHEVNRNLILFQGIQSWTASLAFRPGREWSPFVPESSSYTEPE